MRLVLLTGKGGVGKTSLASATAVLAAERGRRTLLTSADPAHSLSDVWRRRLDHRPRVLADGLWGQEVNVTREIEESWGEIRDFIARFLRAQGVDELVADELAVLPGAEELVSLLAIERASRDDGWDLVVVDCAPTAATVRLLAFPDAFHRALQRLFGRGRRLTRALRPIAEAYLQGPLPDDGVFDRLQQIDTRLARLHRLLSDPAVTSVRIVTNPQRAVLRESQRILAVMHLFGLGVDAIIMNRTPPAGGGARGERSHLGRARACFGSIPILRATQQGCELTGGPAFRRVGREVYGDEDPTRVLHRERPMMVRRTGDQHVLTLSLPVPERREVRLHVVGEELQVEVGAFRRNLLLPRILRAKCIADAHLSEGKLRVHFEDPEVPVGADPVLQDAL